MYNHIKTIINPQNVATYYQLSKLFSLSNLSKETQVYIHRWFTTLAEAKNFLELDIELVKKVLLSSDLHITSEIEVFNAAEAWISYKYNERKNYSKELLKTVRLSLLSINALKYCLQLDSPFQTVEECQEVIKEVLNEKEKCLANNQNHKITKEVSTRYCKQNNFEILFCACDFFPTEGDISFVDKIDGRNLLRSRTVPTLTENRDFGQNSTPVIYLKGHIYLFDCLYEEFSKIKQVEKYSIVNDSLESVGEIVDDYEDYCACGFIDKIYLIGGCLKDEKTATCRYFNTNDNTWGNVRSMKEVRSSAACTAFEGKIVVSGGWVD